MKYLVEEEIQSEVLYGPSLCSLSLVHKIS